MKTLAIASTLALSAVALASPSQAQTPSRSRAYEPSAEPAQYETERGNVISVTPIVQQVLVPRRVCNDEQVAVGRPPSGAGALLGAIAGGAMGNALGGGAGRAAATAIGVIGGAAVGNSIEAGGQAAQLQTARRCTAQNTYEDRAVAYSVVYEYAGRQYSTQMRQDPGPYVQVQVQVQAAPEGAVAQSQYPAPTLSRPPPVYVERPVYQAAPAPVYDGYSPSPGYYYDPGYAPLGVGLVVGALIGYGAHSGYGGHHGYGWRGGHGH